MIPKVYNCKLFIESIYNFIIENYEIIPKNFNSSRVLMNEVDTILNRPKNEGRSLVWDPVKNVFEYHYCTDFTNDLTHAIHTHSQFYSNRVFCTEPELLALLYIRQSVYGKTREHMIKSLKLWLPLVTMDAVRLQLVPYKSVRQSKEIVICGDLSPEYSLLFLYNEGEHCIDNIQLVNVCHSERFTKLSYIYAESLECCEIDNQLYKILLEFKNRNCNIVKHQLQLSESIKNLLSKHCKDFCVYSIKYRDREIMVKTRRSRSRSPSPVRRRKRRSSRVGKNRVKRAASRSRSRSRSRSPSRRTNRSRSRSRSR